MSSKKTKKVTIKQIAEVAGVSFSTVAKALNDDVLINKETKKKVKRIANELGYYPNLLATGLRKKSTKTIGVILNDLTNPCFIETIQEIENQLSNKNYTMLLIDSNLDIDTENKNIFTMLSKGVDGIIIAPVSSNSKNIQLILDKEVKSVFIDFIPKYKNINYVYVNHEYAALSATEYLIKHGHKNILLINGPLHLAACSKFQNGYIKALIKNGLAVDKSLIVNKYIKIDIVYQKIMDLQKDCPINKIYTAILCVSDLAAMGVYKALKELGFLIPNDYSVVGYDNTFFAPFMDPPLTTVNSPLNIVSKLSVGLLIDQIENDIRLTFQKKVEPNLVVRNSVCKIN
jgi:LacI family transcriptional regulator